MLTKILSTIILTCALPEALSAQNIDSDAKTLDFEAGTKVTLISKDDDCVCLPKVKRSRKGIDWLTNRILSLSPDGDELAFLSLRDNTTNIYVKDLAKPAVSRQRTNRGSIVDFSYSPDGDKICFTEQNSNYNSLFVTDAHKGYVCRQITSGSQDYSPVYDREGRNIYFVRIGQQGPEIWTYDLEQDCLSSYTRGMNPYPSPDGNHLYFARTNETGRGEIWRLNLSDGVEECIVSDPLRSFFSPLPSPDGSILLIVGSSKTPVPLKSGNVDVRWNTDIFTCNPDGTDLLQRTYHRSDDLSPVWSHDGKSIYYISQRGNATDNANIWKLEIE